MRVFGPSQSPVRTTFVSVPDGINGPRIMGVVAICLGLAAACGGPSATSEPTPPPTDSCAVSSVGRIRPTGQGLDWSYTNNKLVVANWDDNQISQVYTLNPDGTNVQCITCGNVAGGPPVSVHKGVPHWSPDARYIYLQAERPGHPGIREFAEPGNGRWNEIWATTADGSQWWQLTDYSSNNESGVLFPVPSPDGRRMAWADRYAPANNPGAALASIIAKNPIKDIWGYWRLNIADIVVDSLGNVHLSGTQTFQPGGSAQSDAPGSTAGASFYEMQIWSKDGSSIYFASDINRPQPQVLDVWRMNLSTQQLTPLTSTSNQWEEHVGLSPSGSKLVMMSSECCNWNPGDASTLAAELYLVNTDGSNKRQLTFFNTAGNAMYESQGRVYATKAVWSPDGTQLIFNRTLVPSGNFNNRTTELWRLVFAGACGAS